jgi:hypothetical protein
MRKGGEGYVRWGSLVGRSRFYVSAVAGMESAL